MNATYDDIPASDKIEGAPHPRDAARLIGQTSAEATFLEAFTSNRLHHGWLITGPRGIGKATLAWRLARFLLATPPDDEAIFAATTPQSLDLSDGNPIVRRVNAMSDPGLLLLRRLWDEKLKRHKQDITIDELRKLKSFFALSSASGGRRVVIVDAADEMNNSAANALLKVLEEPPEGAILLLISHQPSRLLPTIRSRCRKLRLSPLGPENLSEIMTDLDEHPTADEIQKLGELSGGSVGEALRILNLNGLVIYQELVNCFRSSPNYDRPRALKVADGCVGRANAAKFDLTLRLIDLFLARMARFGAGIAPKIEVAKGELALFNRLSSHVSGARKWAELQQELSASAGHGQAVNLDPAALILDMVFKINDTAAKLAA